MEFDDRPKLPRATIHGEKLYVEGEKEPYFLDREDTISLRVNALTIYRGYAPDQTRKEFVESLYGIATLEDGDRFAVIGLETDPTTLIRFHLQSVPDTETEFHWRASISFIPHDWEDPNWPECFSIGGHCTSQYFDDLLAAVRRGHVDHIRVSMKTPMWTKEKSSMFRRPRTWHLAPPIDREPARACMLLESHACHLTGGWNHGTTPWSGKMARGRFHFGRRPHVRRHLGREKWQGAL